MSDSIHRRHFLQRAGLAALAVSGRWAEPAARAGERPAPKVVNALLEPIRKEHHLPGLAAAALRGDRVVAEGVAGVRRVGEPDRITPEDRFGLGSCTKRMTALLVARLVDAGKLTFDTTLADALPDVKMGEAYRPVTVAQLLSFTGGIQPYTQIGPRLTPVLFEQGTVAERRARFVDHVLQQEPVAEPGSKPRYSNASYVLAAFVASRRGSGEPEALMAEYVFRPLSMTRAGFGRPRSKQRPNEPWLHLKRGQGYVPEPDGDRLPEAVLVGAGGVHCSIRDFARFAAYELSAAKGRSPLLSPATAKRLQRLGRPERDKGPGEDTYFGGAPWLSAGLLVAPGEDFAAVAAVNGGDAEKACTAAIEALRKAV
jgi:CubicO group peptidase (beta-lactamase class C family)